MSDTGQTFPLILFGATGDLAQRMLLPSLYHLHRDGLLRREVQILATGRSDHDRDAFLALTESNLKKRLDAADFDAKAFSEFAARMDFASADARDLQALVNLVKKPGMKLGAKRLFYLSTAPDLYGPIANALANAELVTPQSRIVLEKPIGSDLASSKRVNADVGAAFQEHQIFRVDHYLGKETVQNLLALRFANTLFEPLWNARSIEHVQITVAETVGLETRADYYDKAGALRDMVQNHMVQLLCLVAMEPPARYEPDAVRNEKIKVLKSLRPIGAADAPLKTVAGQYGSANGGDSYAKELGRASDTETFVAIKAEIDNWRWAGVPFYLRTGKRMPQRFSEIVIQFKPVPYSIFHTLAQPLAPNKLIIRLQPDENIRLMTMAKEPGLTREGLRLREVGLNLSLTDAFSGERRRIAYERLMLDAIDGDGTLFVRRDEVDSAWDWIDSIREAWRATGAKPKLYTAGTIGPTAAIALIERDGRSWHE
jgi:glucose-6-phosphate 1-dehydrogenase